MGKFIGYGAAIVTLVLALAGIWEYFFVRKGSKRRIVTLVIFLIASVIVIANQYETDSQHQKDVGQIQALQHAVNKANDTQQKSAQQFLQAQDGSRKEFLQQFNQLSEKVAKLQTQAATEALQKQAADLQSELGDGGIYFTPPNAIGCGLTRVANGAGSTCTACWARR